MNSAVTSDILATIIAHKHVEVADRSLESGSALHAWKKFIEINKNNPEIQ
jgi:hypothetical protein